MAKLKAKTDLVSPDEAKRRHDVMDQAILRFQGQLDELEGALGMYMIGRHFGWKVLYTIHTKSTVRSYESILGISVREEFLEFGPDAKRSNAYHAINALSNFWKFVSGEVKIDLDRDQRRSIS